MVRAEGRLVHTGDDRGPAGRADAGGRVGVGKASTLLRQLVDVRRNRVLIPKASDVRTDVFTR